jgi:signal transduction histidine kinase
MSFASPEPAGRAADAGGVRRLWRRTGVRLFALQALALVLAFGLTGVIARISIQRLDEQAMRAEVTGEARAMEDEWRQKGSAHLPYTVAKRSRLWHGFEYGLAGPDGRRRAGDPSLSNLRQAGWSRTPSAAGLVLTRTERLPDGAWLSVGRVLTTEQRQLSVLTTLLAASGAAGVAICLASAWLAMRWTWGRIDKLSATAALVADGRLDVRAPVRAVDQPDEIDELSLAFNQMLDRIGRLIEELRRVTTDIAHDMRRPLNRLGQKLDRLGRKAETAPAIAAEVRRLEDDFQEIIRTFDALLQLAEIEGRRRPDGRVDLAAVAERVADALRPDIEASGRVLAARLESAEVAGDTDLLAQALANLLENALRHTPAGARIEVSVLTEDGAPRLLVRDDGPGIAPDLRERALAPFGRLEASRSTPGSGLGLAIAASVATRHGARLELGDARPGLEVSIAFPATPTRGLA